ncbi:MAG: hypothetical protein M1829_005951 [Trizodia sp. TS-e1964]|nr:MAG: hypothetical protein M1829_005951 [Trizodia sp. TS-e1964]
MEEGAYCYTETNGQNDHFLYGFVYSPSSEDVPTPEYVASYQSSHAVDPRSPISSVSRTVYTPESTNSYRKTSRTSFTGGSPSIPFHSIGEQYPLDLSHHGSDLAGVAGGGHSQYDIGLSSSTSQDGSAFGQSISLHQDIAQDWLWPGTPFDVEFPPLNNQFLPFWEPAAHGPWNAVGPAEGPNLDEIFRSDPPNAELISWPGTLSSDYLLVNEDDFENEQEGHNPMSGQAPAFRRLAVPLATNPPVHPPPAKRNEKRRLETHEASLIRGNKQRKVSRRKGKLDPQVAENARKRRIDGSCWRCVFHKKGCERESDDTLRGLVAIFVPEALREQSKHKMIEDFIGRNFPEWTDQIFPVEVDAGFGSKIQLVATALLIHPRNPKSELVMDNRFVIDEKTRKKKCIQRESLPLAIKIMVPLEFKDKCLNYLQSVLEENLDRIPIRCFPQNTLQSELLKVVCGYHRRYRGPHQHLLGKAIKMLVLTFVMTHALTMERTKVEDVARKLNRDPSQTYFASPKLLNKQIKGIMEEIHHSLMENVLELLQKVIRDQNKSDWAVAFSLTLLVIMVVEDFQISIGEFAYAEYEEHHRTPSGFEDISKIRKDIDKHVVDFVVELFHLGFKTAKFNPLKESRGSINILNQLDVDTRSLVQHIRELMIRHAPFMKRGQIEEDDCIEVFQKWNEGRLYEFDSLLQQPIAIRKARAIASEIILTRALSPHSAMDSDSGSSLSSAPSSPIQPSPALRPSYPSPTNSQESSPIPAISLNGPAHGDLPPPFKKRRVVEPKKRTMERLDLGPLESVGIDELTGPNPQLDLLLKVLRNKKKIVVVAGAGISVSAGIPDFRSSTGLFTTLRSQHNLKSSGKHLFDASVYKTGSSTSSFHDMVRSLSDLVSSTQPTAFHQLLASLAQQGRLLRLYSQNVDGIDTSLSPLATEIPLKTKGPWPRTIQLHGGLGTMVCQKCHELSDLKASLFEGPEPPPCLTCEENDSVRTTFAGKRSHGIGRLRPRIVLYNEHNPDDEAIGAVTKSDLRTRPDALIVVGTSLKVPGVRRIVREMCGVVRGRRDGITIWINNDPEPIGREFNNCWDLVVQGKCDEVARLANLKRWDHISNDFSEVNSSDVENAKASSKGMQVLVDAPMEQTKDKNNANVMGIITPLPSPRSGTSPPRDIPCKTKALPQSKVKKPTKFTQGKLDTNVPIAVPNPKAKPKPKLKPKPKSAAATAARAAPKRPRASAKAGKAATSTPKISASFNVTKKIAVPKSQLAKAAAKTGGRGSVAKETVIQAQLPTPPIANSTSAGRLKRTRSMLETVSPSGTVSASLAKILN